MITQGIPVAFKQELLLGTHDFSSDTFMLALYTSAANIGSATTAYTTDGEASAVNYTPGGRQAVVSVLPTVSQGGVYISFNNVVFGNFQFPVGITARGAMIYNSSKSNKVVMVLDFGVDITSTTSFVVTMPTANMTYSILRIN